MKNQSPAAGAGQRLETVTLIIPPNMQKTLQEAAVVYAERGWSVIPLRPSDKRPALQSWEHLQQKATPPDEVAHHWRNHPGHNVGVVTGQVSGFFVVDIDGEAGEGSLAELVAEHGPFPDTVEAITGGGGRHILLQYPGYAVANRTGLRPGIDIRGDGGYIVAPPSIRPCGRRYEWEASNHPDEIGIAPAPLWLLDLLQRPVAGQAKPVDRGWSEFVSVGAVEGERNDKVARLAGYLLRLYVDPYVVLTLIQAWNATSCTPPLAEAEVAKTVNSIAGKELRRRGGGRRGA